MLEKGRSAVYKGCHQNHVQRMDPLCSLHIISVVFWQFVFPLFCSEEPLSFSLPFVIASCIGLSASQSLFKADRSHVALSSVVSSQFSLLPLIMLTSLKLNLEIYLSLLHLVSRKDLRWLQKRTHAHTSKWKGKGKGKAIKQSWE